MAARRTRAWGAGTLHKRSDGRWSAQIYVTDATGHRGRRTLYGTTRKEVEDQREALLEAQARNEPIAPAHLTVEIYLQEWLETIVQPRVRATTFASYQRYVDKYLVPDLGHTRLGALSARQIRVYLESLRQRGTGDRTIQYVHATLRAALEDAMREELIPKNVAKLVRVRRPVQREARPLSIDEVRQLFAYHHDDKLLPMLVVFALLGLRLSEVLGLRWSEVDLDRGSLRVVRGVQRVNGKLIELPPKTERSRRTIPLPAIVMDVLKQHRKQQDSDRAELAETWPATDYIFASSVGTAMDPRNCTRVVQRACRNAGVRVVRLHEFRHGCISVLLELGVPPRTAMEIVGHTTLEMTMNVYGHVNLDSKRHAMDQMGDLFSEASDSK